MTSLDLPVSSPPADENPSKGIIGAIVGALAAGIIHFLVIRSAPWTYGVTAALIGISGGLLALKLAGGKTWNGGVTVIITTLVIVLACEGWMYRSSAVELPARYSFEEWIKPPQRVYFDADEQYERALAKHRELTALPESTQRERHAARIATLKQVNATNTSFGQYTRTNAGRFRMTILFAALGMYLGYSIAARTRSDN